MATTTSARITRADSDKGSAPVAAATLVPQNGLVFRNSSGYAVNIVASGANPLLGIAEKEADNTDGAAGDLNVEMFREGQFLLTFSDTLTVADIGKKAYATDNNTCSVTGTSRTPIGVIAAFVSASTAMVALNVDGSVAA